MGAIATHIEQFMKYLVQERGLSPNTAISYKCDLDQFQLLALQRGARNAEDLIEGHVLAWIAQLEASSAAAATIGRKLTALHSFAKFLVVDDVRKDDFMSGIEGRKRPKHLPRTLSQPKVRRLLSQPDPADPRSLRDKALCEMLYATGLRVSELAALTLDDLDLDGQSIRCFGKGRKERMVPIGKVACDYLALYLEQRRAQASGKSIPAPASPVRRRRGQKDSSAPTIEEARSPFLFPAKRGGQISREEIRKIVVHYGEAADLTEHVTPHVLRHSFASHLLDNGADLRTIQEMLGHATIASTEIYTHVTNRKLKDIYKKSHPRAK